MTEQTNGFSRRRIIADRVALALAAVAVGVYALLGIQTALTIGVYAFLFGTSTAVVTYALTQLTGIQIETDPAWRRILDGSSDGVKISLSSRSFLSVSIRR